MAEAQGNTAAVQVEKALYQAVLNRLNITWKPDKMTAQNIKDAMEEARDYLRKRAGSPGLTFEAGEARSLLIECTFYIISHQLAEFGREYRGELLALRLAEGFDCGKEEI